MIKRFGTIFLTINLLFSIVVIAQAATNSSTDYPRLANYYLKYYSNVPPTDLDKLRRWDLLIIPNDYQWAFPDFFTQYKQAKPDGKILAYTYPAMVMTSNLNSLCRQVDEQDLWLRTGRGDKLEMWPNLYAVNINKPAWTQMNISFWHNELDQQKWDGVFFDTVETSLERFNHNGIDLDGDRRADSLASLDASWQQGLAKFFTTARQHWGQDKLLIINGSSLPLYQTAINGRMFETFPAFWEGEGTWTASMEQYLNRLPAQNKKPLIYVINSNTNNTGQQQDYQKMRFGLASTLLGDGYFSFDRGDQAHEQTWWYDEYSVQLGQPTSKPYNLLAPHNSQIQPGLWRRDFDYGVAIVNSTNKRQLYTLKKENLEKIRGQQAPLINNGQVVNYLLLEPNDGLILLKRDLKVVNQTFYNGGFVRVFDQRGQSVRNGFFVYQANLAGGDQTILFDMDGQGGLEQAINRRNEVMITRQGRIIYKWYPFSQRHLGRPSIALYNPPNKNSDLVIGAGAGLKPVVRVYNYQGRLLTPEWLAFNARFRGGVNVSAGQLNNRGEMAIAVTPQGGMKPLIKLYSNNGQQLAPEWLAFDARFRGGVSTAIGDISGDGEAEIVAVASIGGGPQVRIFNRYGKLLGQFQAFKDEAKTGYQVMIDDLDGDGRGEILVGYRN